MDEQQQHEEEQQQQQTPAEIMRGMKEDYERRLAAKDAEMAALRTQHAAEIRDILTGRDEAANKEIELNDRVKAAAKKIQKNLGVL